MMEVSIEKLDNKGRGIAYINDKITFIKNALPKEIVEVNITKESKKYQEGEVTKYIKESPLRIKSICPYFNICGGCDLLNISYEDTLKFKKQKLEDIISKYANISTNIDIIPSDNKLNYRNKITLKVINKRIGYYESSTHKLVEINDCLLAEKSISNIIPDLHYLNIKNGEIVVRANYNDELIISITTKDKITPNISYLKEHHKIAGIILNDKVINGDTKYIEIINHLLFNVSYDSFFQINRNICSKLFKLIEENTKDSKVILDLYCGVGTLGIAANVEKAYGIEIVKNAVLNAISNSKINKRNNIYYMLGDVGSTLPKIKDEIDTVIVDPPRAGLDDKTKDTLINFKPNKIIYVSCDPMTLARDIKDLSKYYNLKSIKGLDMFPYTEHCESVCILERK